MIFEALYKASLNGELILVNNGLLDFHLRKDGQITIREILVNPDYEGDGIATEMLNTMIKMCNGAKSVFAKCPQDLESNGWYKHVGFELECIESTKTGRLLNCWRLKLND